MKMVATNGPTAERWATPACYCFLFFVIKGSKIIETTIRTKTNIRNCDLVSFAQATININSVMIDAIMPMTILLRVVSFAMFVHQFLM
jgi:hypothetical protein